jgi:hypothetical protein
METMSLSESEEKIFGSIVVASDNDPNRPEFPPNNPMFPATPTYQIKVPGFSNVWLKDESVNPTGTHKDRMAWEIVVTYKNFLLDKRKGNLKGALPKMSLISSGSAAIAIQTMLLHYKLPSLKVLVDLNLNGEILNNLKKLGCEIYTTDLARKPLSWKEILALTHNEEGFDITSDEALDQTSRFYDWMSYEIINSSPEYCFIPFGTGNLYDNILNINKQEVTSNDHDPRFRGDVSILKTCNFMGATSNNPRTKADKLYSPHLPFVHYDEQWMRLYKSAGFCGQESNVYLLREEFLDEAIKLSKNMGINCEPSGIAGLALLLQMKDRLPKDGKMLIVNTGKTKIS